MYNEIARIATIAARRQGTEFDTNDAYREPAGVAKLLQTHLAAAGWECSDRAWSCGDMADETAVPIHLSLSGWNGCRAQKAQAVSQCEALTMLSKGRFPLRKKLRLTIGSDLDLKERALVWRPAWDPGTAAGGWLLLPNPGNDELVALPGDDLLYRARTALINAQVKPMLRLWPHPEPSGLGYAAPVFSRGGIDLAYAIKAYASLVYGLAGFGVMAFDFDFDF